MRVRIPPRLPEYMTKPGCVDSRALSLVLQMLTIGMPAPCKGDLQHPHVTQAAPAPARAQVPVQAQAPPSPNQSPRIRWEDPR